MILKNLVKPLIYLALSGELCCICSGNKKGHGKKNIHPHQAKINEN